MKELLTKINRIPIVSIALLYCAWLGYDYYSWLESPTSELGQKKAAVVTMKNDLDGVKKKLVAAEEFYKNLETLRDRIRQLTGQLESTKTNLSADIDIANFVRMVTHEANKLKIAFKGIKPNQEEKKEYYIEVPFTVNMKGAFIQILVFFDRIAKFQQVIRVSEFQMKPTGNVFTKYVELDAVAKLVAYKYLGTHADEVSLKDEMKDRPMTTPAKEGGK